MDPETKQSIVSRDVVFDKMSSYFLACERSKLTTTLVIL